MFAVCGLRFTDFRQVAFFMQTKISIRMNSPYKATEQSRDLSVCLLLTRGRGGLTHHLHSEAPAGNRRMAMTFAKLRLIVFLRCIGLDWMPL